MNLSKGPGCELEMKTLGILHIYDPRVSRQSMRKHMGYD